jgi:hypothetical protein
LIDWNRKYRELWLDREKSSAEILFSVSAQAGGGIGERGASSTKYTSLYQKIKKRASIKLEALLLLISQQPIKQSMFIWRGLFQPWHGQ